MDDDVGPEAVTQPARANAGDLRHTRDFARVLFDLVDHSWMHGIHEAMPDAHRGVSCDQDDEEPNDGIDDGKPQGRTRHGHQHDQ